MSSSLQQKGSSLSSSQISFMPQYVCFENHNGYVCTANATENYVSTEISLPVNIRVHENHIENMLALRTLCNICVLKIARRNMLILKITLINSCAVTITENVR